MQSGYGRMNNIPGIGWFTLDLYTPSNNNTDIYVSIKSECQFCVEIKEKRVLNLRINNMSVRSSVIKPKINIIKNIFNQSMSYVSMHSHSFCFLELDGIFIVFCSIENIDNIISVIDSAKQINSICFSENIYHGEIENSILLFLKIDTNDNTDSKE